MIVNRGVKEIKSFRRIIKLAFNWVEISIKMFFFLKKALLLNNYNLYNAYIVISNFTGNYVTVSLVSFELPRWIPRKRVWGQSYKLVMICVEAFVKQCRGLIDWTDSEIKLKWFIWYVPRYSGNDTKWNVLESSLIMVFRRTSDDNPIRPDWLKELFIMNLCVW